MAYDKLSKQEHPTLRAVRVALYCHWRYVESNPDVGMGPRMESLLDDVLDLMDMTLIPEHRAIVLAHTRNWK